MNTRITEIAEKRRRILSAGPKSLQVTGSRHWPQPQLDSGLHGRSRPWLLQNGVARLEDSFVNQYRPENRYRSQEVRTLRSALFDMMHVNIPDFIAPEVHQLTYCGNPIPDAVVDFDEGAVN